MDFSTTSNSKHYGPTQLKLRSLPLFLVVSLLMIGVSCGAPVIMKLNHGFEKGQVKYARWPVTNHETVNKTGSMARSLYELLEHSMNLVKRTLLISLTSGANSQSRSRWPKSTDPDSKSKSNLDFPMWMSRLDRKQLGTSIQNIKADIIVAQDGSGTAETISEAINIAPDNSPRPILILVKAGIYAENNLTVGIKKKNLWFMGEGIRHTVITGNKSFEHSHLGTIDTATFAVMGSGFVARGISFVNEAGPTNDQAVALLVEADCTILYQCEIKGYQDTLFVRMNRQFYRECDIYGTVDFIFGNAQAVFQNCTIWARKPLVGQANTITAQDRGDPTGVTGMSFHACNIRATPDLEAVKSIYLGRPWNTSSRVVYMESFIGDHVDPKGWLEWVGKPITNDIYYGEYKNVGPGANTNQRVKWALHVNMTSEEAANFTPDNFLLGQDWIPATQVPYIGGLLV